jgi:hypothetical protein
VCTELGILKLITNGSSGRIVSSAEAAVKRCG